MRVLITGATGFVGTALTERVSSVYDTIALVRTQNHMLSANIQQLVTANIFAADLPDNLDVIIHLAGRAHILNEQTTDPLSEFRKVNVDGTLQLARQALDKKIKRFIFMSSIGVNGSVTLQQPFTEDALAQPHADYAVSKSEAEQELKKLFAGSATELVIIRPPLVYAAHAPGNFARLLKLASTNLPLPLAHVNNKRSFVALENLVDFISCCITHPLAANELFLIADQQVISTEQMVRLLKAGMNKKPILFYMPKTVLKIGSMLVGKRKLYEQLYESLEIDCSKACSLLNWKPPLDTYQALEHVGRSHRL
ncbi:NAD-dependent epimerase/dehydratase family protein [Alkanindiges illinoisensis]|uniref:NAD-dependent epimerase/dehydratase family protein n=1 Tax=Alkanindiges illinoisensis TaxID=197183 RepID=A0A4Y7XBV5_9GAMM|nr:NAD-dependent epimerase/dehydratase family protein [Alkanindiges illinoisensis]TEU26818.1 NAD-dependent epimerase/dehydratase family protein [Alkanindiges illinoisensis]